MAKPLIHAESSVKKFGGKVEDYLDIHNLMDSSKATVANSRHRALTHTSWFVGTILEKIFGVYIVNSDGKKVSVRDVGEQHVLEDFGGRFIPSAQDYLSNIEMEEWMLKGKGAPPASCRKLEKPAAPGKQQSWDQFVYQPGISSKKDSHGGGMFVD